MYSTTITSYTNLWARGERKSEREREREEGKTQKNRVFGEEGAYWEEGERRKVGENGPKLGESWFTLGSMQEKFRVLFVHNTLYSATEKCIKIQQDVRWYSCTNVNSN